MEQNYRSLKFKEFQKELVDAIRHFCVEFEKNDIFWWANSGTLLGAARDGDLIDWDDDADMTMIATEFHQNKEKMQVIADKINFEVVDPTKVAGLDVARIFSKEYILVEYEGETFMTKIYIDIMLGIPSKRPNKIKETWWEIINKYSWIYGNFYNILPKVGWVRGKKVKIGWWRNALVFFSKVITFPFMWWVPLLQNRKLKAKPKYKGNTYQLFYCYNISGLFIDYKKENFIKTKMNDFEVNIPVDYENELTVWYGENWKSLPSKDKQIPHNLTLTPYTGKEKYKINPFLIK